MKASENGGERFRGDEDMICFNVRRRKFGERWRWSG